METKSDETGVSSQPEILRFQEWFTKRSEGIPQMLSTNPKTLEAELWKLAKDAWEEGRKQ